MDIQAVFETFTTAKALGEAIGKNPIRAAEMRKRGSIPPKYWPALVRAAQQKAQAFNAITYEALAKAHAEMADDESPSS